MRNAIKLILLLSLLLLNLDSAWALDERPLNLEAMIEEALKNNPELNAARDNIDALSQIPDRMSSLPNPAVSIGLMNMPLDTFDLDQEAMTQKTLGVTQSFPYPGKLALKREMSEQSLIGGRKNLEALKLQVVAEVKRGYYSLFFINKSIEITERNRRLLQEFIRLAETKYSVGSGIQQDVLKAQVELSKLFENLMTLKEKKNTLKARLNYLMDRMPQAPLADPGDAGLTSVDISVDDFQKEAESEHPLLHAVAASIEARRRDHLLAEKEYYPDFNVSLQYSQRDAADNTNRPDFASAMLMMKVPLWFKTKEDKKVMEASARIRESEKKYKAARNLLFFRIEKLKGEIGRTYEQALLFRDGIIPQATASLDSALAAYHVNKVDFMTLLNNQITLFNFEIQYYKALADHEVKLAELEEAVGKPIENWGSSSEVRHRGLSPVTEVKK